MQPARRRLTPLHTFLGAHWVSALGNSFAAVALPWFVLQTTGSVAQTGVAAAAGFVPQLVAGVFGGVLVDRAGPKRMAMFADVASAVCVALVPLLHTTVGLSFGWLLALIALGALLDVPGASAQRALMPALADASAVSRDRANASFEVAYSTTDLLGPVLAGILITASGAETALWLNAASFAVSAAVVGLAVPRGMGEPDGPSQDMAADATGVLRTYLADVGTGLRFLAAEPAVRLIAVGFLFVNIIVQPLFTVVLPAFADQGAGGAVSLGALATAAGAGGLVGTLGYGWWGARVSRRRWWLAGFLVSPFFYWLIAAGASAAIVGIGLFLTRCVTAGMQPMSVTVRQERIPPRLRGRVFAASSAVAVLAAPLGTIGAGVLIERAGLRPAIFIMAVTGQALGVAMLFVPAVRSLDVRGAYAQSSRAVDPISKQAQRPA